MRGYIREYRPGKYSYTIYIGKINGRPKKIEKGGFCSKADCDLALNIALSELGTTGTVFKPSDKTLEQLYDEFIHSAAALSRKTSTIAKYKTIWMHHLQPELGYKFIRSITPKDIDNFTVSLKDAGYSESFIKSIFNCIVTVFRYAVDHGYLRNSPADSAVIPKVIKPPVEIFKPEEISKLLDLLKNSACVVPVTIGLYTGMREGEVLGLRWRDINFSKRTIDINHQMLVEKGRYCLGETKTESSNRVIKMNQYLTEYLHEQKEKQRLNKEIAAEFWKENKIFNYFTGRVEVVPDFVNVKANGSMLTNSSIKYVSRVAKPAGIDFYFHKLRHTHATQLIENGGSIKLVQERLGHSRPDITLRVYSHVTPLHEANIIDAIPVYQPASDTDVGRDKLIGQISDRSHKSETTFN